MAEISDLVSEPRQLRTPCAGWGHSERRAPSHEEACQCAHAKHGICWHLTLGLPSPQNCEEIFFFSAAYKPLVYCILLATWVNEDKEWKPSLHGGASLALCQLLAHTASHAKHWRSYVAWATSCSFDHLSFRAVLSSPAPAVWNLTWFLNLPSRLVFLFLAFPGVFWPLIFMWLNPSSRLLPGLWPKDTVPDSLPR